MRHAGAFTYRMHSIPQVPEVLAFMQREGRMQVREAYGSLNMGAGFALFVPQGAVSATIAAARSTGVAAWDCGVVEPGPRRVIIEPLGIEYAADELALRG
jgi:phosphoribosylformylglycinamidine cyclo-ligase